MALLQSLRVQRAEIKTSITHTFPANLVLIPTAQDAMLLGHLRFNTQECSLADRAKSYIMTTACMACKDVTGLNRWLARIFVPLIGVLDVRCQDLGLQGVVVVVGVVVVLQAIALGWVRSRCGEDGSVAKWDMVDRKRAMETINGLEQGGMLEQNEEVEEEGSETESLDAQEQTSADDDSEEDEEEGQMDELATDGSEDENEIDRQDGEVAGHAEDEELLNRVRKIVGTKNKTTRKATMRKSDSKDEQEQATDSASANSSLSQNDAEMEDDVGMGERHKMRRGLRPSFKALMSAAIQNLEEKERGNSMERRRKWDG